MNKEIIDYIFSPDLLALYFIAIIILLSILLKFKSWFTVDKRILGIYRIFLGILLFSDIFRRWDVRHIFYSANGIVSHSGSSANMNKSFSLLHTFNGSFEITILFIFGMIFSLSLILGYKTKLSHFIAGIILISIHNKVTLVENAGDFILNCMIVWTFFLPLGASISLDSLKNSLKNYKENNPNELNNINIPNDYKYSTLAYFAILFQISAIYFFTGLNKNGVDWTTGTAVHYFYQLDTFLTPIGSFLRDYVNEPFSKISTYGTRTVELIIPWLLFIPFYSRYFRLLAVILLTILHMTISASLSIGLFSQTMIISFILLLDGQFIESIKSFIVNKKKTYILFYDSDCGFCHYTARIIKRLDVFKKIKFADQHSKNDIIGFDSLISKTAIVYNQNTGKTWTKHHAFAKIISCLPFGIFISWIFYIPGISQLLGITYDTIATNRTKISGFFGLPICDIKINKNDLIKRREDSSSSNYYVYLNRFKYIISSSMVFILLLSAVNYNLVANKSVNEYMKEIKYKEPYTDLNNNGKWDSVEKLRVLVSDPELHIKKALSEAHLDNAETYEDLNNNRIWDDYNLEFKYIKKIKPLMNYTRMIQRWDMFSPNVLKTDKWIIVEARLDNAETYEDHNNNGRWDNGEEFIDVLNGAWDDGEKFVDANSNEIYDEGEEFTDALNRVWDDGEIIDPFTGKAPVLDKIDYEILWQDINQFWRKYFGRIITKKGKPKLNHIKKLDKWIRRTDYFEDQIGDEKIKSIKIWYLTQRNPKPGFENKKKVRKKLLYETPPKYNPSIKRKKTKTNNKSKDENILDLIKKNNKKIKDK